MCTRQTSGQNLQRRHWSQQPSPPRSRGLVVEAAKKGGRGGKGGGRKGGRGSGGGGGNTPAKTKSPQLQMADFRRDETLMFDPVKADPGALSIVYAYPNDYTVGITSLGYQLVGLPLGGICPLAVLVMPSIIISTSHYHQSASSRPFPG